MTRRIPTRFLGTALDAAATALGVAVGVVAAASLFRPSDDWGNKESLPLPNKKTSPGWHGQDPPEPAECETGAPAPTAPVPTTPAHRAARTIKLRTLAILAALGAIGAAAFVYFGVYNVAATEQHTALVYHVLHYAMKRSVSVRADQVVVPDLSSPEHVRSGFVLYRQNCLQCHGAPGVAPEPAAFGLRPEPLDLAGRAGREWRPAEIYRVVKHGIKPTGMPAWQFRLSEADIWDLTAFVKMLPTISPSDYKDWDRRVPAAAPVALPRNDTAALGDPKAGKYAMQQYLCTTCHSIPGVTGADKTVGPPLAGIARRAYIGGVLVNTPANMVRWLRDPQAVDPLSAMPNLHIKEQDIRDMTAFLYSLQE